MNIFDNMDLLTGYGSVRSKKSFATYIANKTKFFKFSKEICDMTKTVLTMAENVIDDIRQQYGLETKLRLGKLNQEDKEEEKKMIEERKNKLIERNENIKEIEKNKKEKRDEEEKEFLSRFDNTDMEEDNINDNDEEKKKTNILL